MKRKDKASKLLLRQEGQSGVNHKAIDCKMIILDTSLLSPFFFSFFPFPLVSLTLTVLYCHFKTLTVFDLYKKISHPLTRTCEGYMKSIILWLTLHINALFAVCSLPRNILRLKTEHYTVKSGLVSRENFGLHYVVL